MNKVIKINFEDMHELVERLIEEQFENEEIRVVGTYDCINELLKEFISSLYLVGYEFSLHDIEFCSEELSNYNKEYLLETDEDWNICVEPFYINQNNDYLICEGENVFVQKGVDLKCLYRSDFNTVYSFSFYNEDEECEENCDCNECKCKNDFIEESSDNMITQSWVDKDGTYYSRSVCSKDKEFIKFMSEAWKDVRTHSMF